MTENPGSIVLVTGGSGFLGQHIVWHLMENADWVKEVHVFDVRQYKNLLGHKETKPLVALVGDLTNPEAVNKAVQRVTAVIHTASYVDCTVFPNMEKLKQINIQGTRNLIEACRNANVSRFVYTSSMDVVISGLEDIIDGNESLPRLKRTVYPGYGDTKSVAEGDVLKANGALMANWSPFHTVALRPVVMYGEQDSNYVTLFMKVTKQLGGTIFRWNDQSALTPYAYVGNTAWAHVLAMKALVHDTEIAGQVFFITDDTPPLNTFDFLEKFMHPRGYKTTKFHVPFILMVILVMLVKFCLLVVRPFKKVNSWFTLESMFHTNHSYLFSSKKAETLFNWKPIYSAQEAIERSIGYYKTVPL